MDAQRFFSVAYDSRNHPKVDMLRSLEGGIVAYGRYIALLGILYDMGNGIRLSDGMDGLDPTMAAYMMRQLEFDDLDDFEHFVGSLAKVGLIDAEAWEREATITSASVGKEIAFRKAKSNAGKMGGRPKKAPEKAPALPLA